MNSPEIRTIINSSKRKMNKTDIKSLKMDHPTTRHNNVKFEKNETFNNTTRLDVMSASILEPTLEPPHTQDVTFRSVPKKVTSKLERKGSFSLTQTIYKDARTLWHPLKESSTPILKDMATIEKMKKA